MLIRFCLSFFILFYSFSAAQAEQCAAVFSDGVQNNHNDGSITFNWDARVVNSPDNILDSNRAIVDGSGGVSCNTGVCSSSGNITAAINYTNFPANANNVSVGFGQTLTISPDSYNNITLDSSATLYVTPGDYILSGVLSVGNLSHIHITGSGVVRIFTSNTVNIDSSAGVNVGGQATNLLIYARERFDVLSSAEVTAFIYSNKDVTVQSNAVVNGAISGKSVTLFSPSIVNFETTEPEFGDFCNKTPVLPLANYRFDECAYTGVGFEVIDQTGNFSATTHGGVDTFDAGQVERGADIFDEDHYFETSIVLPNDFSVSTWFKKPTSNSDSRLFVLGSMQAGGDLLYINRDSNWRWGGWNPNTGAELGSFSFATLDNNWHHMALVFSGGQTQLYIDGVFTDAVNRVPEGTLKYIGTSFDDVNTTNPQGFRAPIDEFIVFDGVLSAAEILDIYNNQNAGNNYDGSVRAPTDCNPFAAWWQFEENFLDSSSANSYDLTPFNAPQFGSSNPDPANTIGSESTCSYVSFDGSNYTSIDDSNDFNFPSLTVSTWVNPTSYAASGLRSLVSKDEHFEFHINSSGQLYWWWRTPSGTSHTLTSTTSIPLNSWTHVAVVYDSAGIQNMYINGVLEKSASFTDGLANTPCDFYIGTDVGTGSSTVCGGVISSRNFQGHMDEVHIYDRALSANEIQDDLNVVHSCSLFDLDHFEINHDGSGLTCQAENITIKACADASCSSLNTENNDVQLSINGTFDQTVTVSGGSTDTSFSYTNVGNATLSLDQTYECKNGGSTSCDVVFADAGFRFLYGAAESTIIGSQISGNSFVDTVQLQAVENVNGVCTGIFTGNKDVELSQQNIAPGSTTGLNFKVNGASGTTIDKFPTYTSGITLNFGADSKAIIPTPVYLDAGQIRLYAKYDVGGVNLVGNSNDFWVSPAKLVATAKSGGNDIDGNTNTSTTKHKAGQAFDFTVTAYNSLGTAAANITANYTPNDIQFLLTRTGPSSGGFDGSFNYGNGTLSSALSPTYQSVTLNAFGAGFSSTNSASYSEVGLLNLDLQDVNYGFTGNTIVGDAINIGRFYPDHFVQSVAEQGSLDAVCNQNTAFAYTGQVLVNDATKGAISYLVNPVVELTAKNGQGATTQNYTEAGYNKLIAAANFIVAPTTDAAITGKDISLLPLTSNIFAGTVSHNGLVASLPSFGIALNAGVLHYELADADNFFYPRNENSEINAADNDINFLIDQANFVDADLVAITAPVNITDTVGINLRFGRAYLENSFGPETADLPQPFSIQYLNSSGNYVLNEQDSCTNFATTNITLTSGTLDKNLTGVNASTGQLDKGETRAMVLTAPGAGNQGTVNVEYDIYTWLKYDWDWNGVAAKDFSDNPSAIATFGLFRGNDRIIYQREVNN